MVARKRLYVELVGGPFDGKRIRKALDAWEVFQVEFDGRRETYELETDPGLDLRHWAVYKPKEDRVTRGSSRVGDREVDRSDP